MVMVLAVQNAHQGCCGRSQRRSLLIARSASTPLLRRQQAAPDHVKVSEGEHCEEARRVLRQPPIANLPKAPQMLDDLKGMLSAGPSRRAQPVHSTLVGTERLASIGTAVHPIAHPVLLGSEAVQLAPISLVSVQCALLAVQQVRQLLELGGPRVRR